MSVSANAQNKPNRLTAEEIKSQKVAFFTQTLQLTSREAEKFWPIYNEYWSNLDNARCLKMKSLRKLNEALKDDNNSTQEINNLADDYLNKRKQEESLTYIFYNDVKRVIPDKKAAKIFQAEESFRIMLIRQLRHR